MLNAIFFLAASDPSGSALSNSTVLVYYIIGILAIIFGAIAGGYKIYQKQKRHWTDEGITRATQSRAIEENNNQLRENTEAIGKLTQNLSDFVTKVNSDLNGLGHRIRRLEDFRDHGGSS